MLFRSTTVSAIWNCPGTRNGFLLRDGTERCIVENSAGETRAGCLDGKVVVDAEPIYGNSGFGEGIGVCDRDVASTEGKELPHVDTDIAV